MVGPAGTVSAHMQTRGIGSAERQPSWARLHLDCIPGDPVAVGALRRGLPPHQVGGDAALPFYPHDELLSGLCCRAPLLVRRRFRQLPRGRGCCGTAELHGSLGRGRAAELHPLRAMTGGA